MFDPNFFIWIAGASMSFPENRAMTPLTGLGIVMADETTPLVQLRQEAMPAIYKCVYRIMTSRSLIVTTDAKIRLMADGAVHSIHRGYTTVHIISPSYCMRLRVHYAVALVAVASRRARPLFSSRNGFDSHSRAGKKLMAESAFGIGRARGFCVPRAKGSRVIVGPLGQSVIARLAPGCDLRVTDRTLADPIVGARAIGFMAHRAVPHRRYVELRDRSLLVYPCVTGLARYSMIAIIGQVLCVREFQVSPHHRVARRRRGVTHIHDLRRRFAARYPGIIRVHDEATNFMVAWVILLLRLVAAQAIRVLRVRREMRLDVGYGMAHGAFLMRGESRFLAGRLNLVADITVGPLAYDLRHFTFNAQMKLVRKVE